MTREEIESFTRDMTQDCAPLANEISRLIAGSSLQGEEPGSELKREHAARLAAACGMLAVAYWSIGEYPPAGLLGFMQTLQGHAIFIKEGAGEGGTH